LATITHRWQRFEKSSDAYKAVTGMLLLLIVMPILVASNERVEGTVTAVIVGATVIISMAASNAHRNAIRASWLASLLIVIATLFDTPREVRNIAALVLAIMLIATPLVILRRIARHEVITATTIWGAVAAYMAFGMAFSLMYAATYAFDAAAFPAIADNSLGNFNYFSFVTMTTLGYGDIAPATDLPRAMVVFETLIGQIYLVVVVARVVSLLGRPVADHRSLKQTLERDPGAGGDEDGEEGDPGTDQGEE